MSNDNSGWDDYDYHVNTGELEDWFEDEPRTPRTYYRHTSKQKPQRGYTDTTKEIIFSFVLLAIGILLTLTMCT